MGGEKGCPVSNATSIDPHPCLPYPPRACGSRLEHSTCCPARRCPQCLVSCTWCRSLISTFAWMTLTTRCSWRHDPHNTPSLRRPAMTTLDVVSPVCVHVSFQRICPAHVTDREAILLRRAVLLVSPHRRSLTRFRVSFLSTIKFIAQRNTLRSLDHSHMS